MQLAIFGGHLGTPELLLILLIVVLLFGARKLPDLARSLGKSINEFRKGREEGSSSEPTESKPEEKKQP